MNSILIFVIFLINLTNSQKIDVTVLYESLCPDSLKFINEQLHPNWAELSPYINLNLIPFGKSSSQKNGQEFQCQHGPMECAGNKIQSCALSAIDDKNTQIQFVHCFMNTFAKTDFGQSCSAQIGLNWKHVEECYASENGIILQLNAEVVTKNVSPKFVPTILYNGVFDQEDQNQSLTNFKAVVCKHLNKLISGICQNVSVVLLR